MTDLTPHQYALGRQVSAAALVHEAKCKEHEAACLMGDQAMIELTRKSVIAASELALDAWERLYRSLSSS